MSATLTSLRSRLDYSPGTYAQLANDQLCRVHELLQDPDRFEPTRHNQWRHRATGLLVEAGYVYGEPWACVLTIDGRQELERYRFTGRDEVQLTAFFDRVGHAPAV